MPRTLMLSILSLFLIVTAQPAPADDLSHPRVRAKEFPLSVIAPTGWESFSGESLHDYEVLFLQTPEDSDYESTIGFSSFPFAGKWQDVVRRQNYHLIVWEGAPVSINEELKMNGAKGHKWVYQARDEDGSVKLYYRLFLLLPKTVGNRRLLLVQGSAPAEKSPEAVPLFNSVARSLAWGLQSEI